MNFIVSAINERSVALGFGEVISPATTHRIITLHTALKTSPFDGFQGSVPAYTTLTIYFDFEKLHNSTMLQGYTAIEKITWWIDRLNAVNNDQVNTKEILIPVCYDEQYGKDLQAVAAQTGLSVDEIVHLHHTTTYTVAMIGFTPGFPYLSGLPLTLMVKRKSQPTTVAAGSVGIAGAQTGIYPQQSPGGWHIIGRTPLVLFDYRDKEPAYFKTGTTIRFSPINKSEFESLIS
ncbi:MAG: 5-oxoprolinase subunit PxpB [Chitinophagaceae bacterium]|nr:MAG: 5-oxoprolinase subunit PxpB [Chitinophagaceae bacterium]